jgi:tRNA nucleotidyltransferase (CCA-adding enzyme)
VETKKVAFRVKLTYTDLENDFKCSLIDKSEKYLYRVMESTTFEVVESKNFIDLIENSFYTSLLS